MALQVRRDMGAADTRRARRGTAVIAVMAPSTGTSTDHVPGPAALAVATTVVASV